MKGGEDEFRTRITRPVVRRVSDWKQASRPAARLCGRTDRFADALFISAHYATDYRCDPQARPNRADLGSRFFLVVERRVPSVSERCAIPVQGECELISGDMLPASAQDDFVTGCIDLGGEQIEVIDLEKAIVTSARGSESSTPAVEALE